MGSQLSERAGSVQRRQEHTQSREMPLLSPERFVKEISAVEDKLVLSNEYFDNLEHETRYLTSAMLLDMVDGIVVLCGPTQLLQRLDTCR
jgi:hypothetical protein